MPSSERAVTAGWLAGAPLGAGHLFGMRPEVAKPRPWSSAAAERGQSEAALLVRTLLAKEAVTP